MKDNIFYDVMLNFLTEHCPIKLTRKGKKWTYSLVINGELINGTTKHYPINKKDLKLAMVKDVYSVLKNVFAFNHDEMLITASRYVGIDDN